MQSYLKSLAALPNVTVKFSRLPPSPQGFIPYARVEHAKYAVADDRSACIGTGNWEWSYFNVSVDASVFVHGAGPARTLASIFDRDWNGPYVTTIEPGGSYAPPRTHRGIAAAPGAPGRRRTSRGGAGRAAMCGRPVCLS
jgi:phosphatidylserine/phosphatidylglycerophosphate/cardiolipin synthase-like enzyme